MKVMRGPNYWSSYRQHTIVMQLDLEEAEHFPTNRIEGFADRLETLLPTMHEHECSEKKPGGFFERVRQGTWLGHVIEHVALELQSLAGMDCGYGRTRSADSSGVYYVVFAYEVEQAGIYAAQAAVKLVDALYRDYQYDLQKDIEELVRIKKKYGLGPSTMAIINEAKKRNIPYQRLDDHSLVLLGQGIHQRVIRGSLTSLTSTIGVDLVSDKEETKRILFENFIPVPGGEVVYNKEEILRVVKLIGFPVVIKPLNARQGKGVTTNIQTMEEAERAFSAAKEYSHAVIVERFIEGCDYRLLVINFKLVAAAKRTPACIIGDNKSTISELIDQVNAHPDRGDGHEKTLTRIRKDVETISILLAKGLDLDSVLPFGQVLYIKGTANLSSGGTAQNVTGDVHPFNIALAERIARITGLNICGIDIVARDISIPLTEENGAVIEVNASPGLRMHLAPSKGEPVNAAAPILDMLYPANTPSRIPVVTVTGTNGKTTVTRLLAHMANKAGHTVGYCTTEGVYINDTCLEHGDCSGPASAAAVLRDPVVDFAVLECARGGILRAGLGVDKCNISIITNITDDHLGLDGINTIGQLAKVKSVVAYSTFDDGYTILNADDDIVYDIRKDMSCRVALFATTVTDRLKRHMQMGGLVAYIDDDYFTVCWHGCCTKIARVDDVPLTMNGRAECMIKNILPCLVAATIQNFSVATIREALRTFIPGMEMTPGRMNIFNFHDFDVMLDYAHNADGMRHLASFMKKTEAAKKIGIITCPGDRRNEDIRNIGYFSAQMFDEIIIRHDDDGRGRTREQITRLLLEGIRQVNSALPVTIVSDEIEAIRYAMANASTGSFIVVCSDKVQQSLKFLKMEQEKEQATFHSMIV
jgi:cyanophycin synthetase